jgi:malonyl CoA-acyl carrier protein transacylase
MKNRQLFYLTGCITILRNVYMAQVYVDDNMNRFSVLLLCCEKVESRLDETNSLQQTNQIFVNCLF